MIAFLAIFLSLYTLLHLYAFTWIRVAGNLTPLSAAALALFMIVMIVAPLIVRMLENRGTGRCARIMALVGYTWMGVLFLLVSAFIVIDVYRVVLFLIDLAWGRSLSFLSLPAGSYLALSMAVVAVVALFGWFDARVVRSEHIQLLTSKIPPEISPLRIVQISDVHLGLIVRQARLKRIMSQVKKAEPDLFVSTGDLVDGRIDDPEALARLFETVQPRYGKFAVTGNHEHYAGLDSALTFTRKAGFRLLRGEALTVSDAVNVVGVDDSAGPGYSSSGNGEGKAVLSRVPKEIFTLLLKHRPDVDRESLGLFDLQLSGHLHGGQVFPFILLTRIFYHFIEGLYTLDKGSSLYVSRGSGTWGPPFRFLAPAEVTIIDVVREP